MFGGMKGIIIPADRECGHVGRINFTHTKFCASDVFIETNPYALANLYRSYYRSCDGHSCSFSAYGSLEIGRIQEPSLQNIF
jgi:hypothetical protein